jgi:hypothetical protein
VGHYGGFGPDEAGLFLEQGYGVLRRIEGWVAPFQFGGVQDFVGQPVLVGGDFAPRERAAFGRTDHEPSRERHQILARFPFQSLPQLVGPQ